MSLRIMISSTALVRCTTWNNWVQKFRITRMYSTGGKSEYKRKHRLHNFEDLLENEVLYGRSVCNIALQASRRPIFKLHLLKLWETSEPTDSRVVEVIELASKRGIPTTYKDRKILDNMSSHRPHQGICLEVGELLYTNLDEQACNSLVTKATQLPNLPLWILLAGIIDPMNMGAILRSCLYFNVDNVIATSGCAPMTPVLSKASSGAAEILQVYSTNQPKNLIQSLITKDWDIIGTVGEQLNKSDESSDAEDIRDVHLRKPSLVIFGSEGSGIPDELLELCTTMVSIKAAQPSIEYDTSQKSLRSLVGNLNVSTAAAVILHEMTKNR